MLLTSRRSILRGLFAMPAVVAASSLMPIRGIIQAVAAPIIKPPRDGTWPDARYGDRRRDAITMAFRGRRDAHPAGPLDFYNATRRSVGASDSEWEHGRDVVLRDQSLPTHFFVETP